jgi:hypothetical protein
MQLIMNRESNAYLFFYQEYNIFMKTLVVYKSLFGYPIFQKNYMSVAKKTQKKLAVVKLVLGMLWYRSCNIRILSQPRKLTETLCTSGWIHIFLCADP